jgi:hypothetical protein
MSDARHLEDESLEAALYDAVGRPLPITKIEIEPLPHGEGFRWSLHSRGRQIYSTTGTPFEIRAAMDSCAILIESELGLPPPVAAYPERN